MHNNLLHLFSLFLLFSTLRILCNANPHTNLRTLMSSRRSRSLLASDSRSQLRVEKQHSPTFLVPQDGLMQADKITRFLGQPDGVDFDQYSGYVTVDPEARRVLFYYFVESPTNSAAKPLLLWLNGGKQASNISNHVIV